MCPFVHSIGKLDLAPQTKHITCTRLSTESYNFFLKRNPDMINDIFRVAINFTLQTIEGVLTAHYRQSTDNLGVKTDMNALGDAIRQNVNNNLAPGLSEDIEFTSVEIRTFVPPPTPITGIDYDFGTPVPGEVTSAALPPLVTVNIKRLTSMLGRRYRGRQYVSGLAAADAENGQVTTAWAAANAAAFERFAADVINAGGTGDPDFTPCIASLDPTVVSPIPGIRTTDINAAVVDQTLRNQRRRQVGIGS